MKINDVSEFVGKFLNDEKDKAKFLIDAIVQTEISYLFTNDSEYMENYTTFIPKHKTGEKTDTKKLFVKEMRSRVEAYFKLIVRNLRDSVPKAIGNNLVRSIIENMKLKLYDMLHKSREVVEVLNEPESVMIRRKELNDQLKIMRNAQKIIRRDPDLMQVMAININDSDISNHGNDDKKK